MIEDGISMHKIRKNDLWQLRELAKLRGQTSIDCLSSAIFALAQAELAKRASEEEEES